MTIDGFEAQIVDLTSDGEPAQTPLDLTRPFYDLRTDEDRYNGVSGRTTHVGIATLDDASGAHSSVSCTFDVAFYP